jgi:IMP dehydrogenase
MIAPSLQTEGKALQTAQGVGMGARGSSRSAPTGNGSSVDRTPAGVSAN